MSCTRRGAPVLVLAALLLFLSGIGAASSGAATIPNPAKFKLKTKIAKLQVDVAGYIETRELTNTVSDCFPGEHYIQTNRFDFETGNYVNVSVKAISAPGLDTVMTSRFSKAVGTAKTRGSVSEYRTTNHCAPTAPAKLPGPPACVTNAGKLAIALTPGDAPSGDEDLAPLAGRPLMLSVFRKGGGTQAPTCVGQGAGSVKGQDTRLAVVGTSLGPGVSAVLPARLDAVKVFNIRASKRMRRVIVISGSCNSVNVTVSDPPGASPNPGGLNADGDCWLTGKVVLTLRSRR